MSAAPQAGRVSTAELLFEVFGGPAVWFAQLCGGYALVGLACGPEGGHSLAPLRAVSWAWLGLIGLMSAAIVVSLLALWLSWAAFKRTRGEGGGDHRHLLETGAGRTRFLALWGVFLGAGFTVATCFTAFAFLMVPRCVG